MIDYSTKKTYVLPQSWVLYPPTSHKLNWGPDQEIATTTVRPSQPFQKPSSRTLPHRQIDMGESRPRTIPAKQLSLETDAVRQKLTPVCTKNWPQSQVSSRWQIVLGLGESIYVTLTWMRNWKISFSECCVSSVTLNLPIKNVFVTQLSRKDTFTLYCTSFGYF